MMVNVILNSVEMDMQILMDLIISLVMQMMKPVMMETTPMMTDVVQTAVLRILQHVEMEE